MRTLDLHTVPPLGELPELMKAIVIRKEREGEPLQSMKVEEVPLPVCGDSEVLVLVMAAGVNFNGVWAGQGKPVSVFKMHKEPFHIPGSDAAGIVWKVGKDVRRWKVGDEVVVHCNMSCGQCPECNGLDPMACSEQKIWGYETPGGSFAQFTCVQAQQLVPKPKKLSWTEAASYGLTFFTAYRMLVGQAQVKPGDNVLIWGAAGGLGIFAIQLCKVLGANPIAVISSPDKIELVKSLGAEMTLNRREFDFVWRPNETPERVKERTAGMRKLGGAIRELTGGKDADIVFEHVGQETFPTSVYVCKRFGKIVICGATSGFDLSFDVRYLWMRQKSILGSHFANAYQAERANELVIAGKIRPVLDQVFDFARTAEAHQLMFENKHKGKLGISIQAPL
ncbi:MAG: crotonyl-CoA carboxylase/reductase [Polyangia bacterium]